MDPLLDALEDPEDAERVTRGRQVVADMPPEVLDLLGSAYLYIGWRSVTRQLETVHKEIWAAAVEEWSRRLNDGTDEAPCVADRWWLCPTCGIDSRSVLSSGPHAHCTWARS